MKLSIIVPVYNVENYIRECLDSIVAALYVSSGSVEVIVVDDGSTDASGSIVDEYSRMEWFNIIHQENVGVAAARNKGLSVASGDWIWFVDSDDWIETTAIKNILEEINTYPESNMLLFDAFENKDRNEVLWEHFSKTSVLDKAEELSALWQGVLYYPSCCKRLGETNRPLAAPWDKIYKKKFLVDNRIQFREELMVLDDMVFNMEVCGLVKSVAYVKKAIYHYRIVNESITHSYKFDRLGMDLSVWEYIDRYIDKCANVWDRDVTDIRQAFYLRVVKSYGICCMQQFFNEKNELSLRDKIACAKKTTKIPVYDIAFKNAKINKAEMKLKPLIVCGRIHSGIGMWLLSIGQRISK